MKLISLDLTNYRRFKAASLEFPEGVIGILGMNGVGKSTIIEAIAWVLYGNQPTIVRTQKEHLKRFGATPAEICEVKLGFELDGDKYIVLRKMAGKNYSTTAEVMVNGTSVATTTKAVTNLIEARLGMDYQAFYTSVFAKQKELNALSTLDPNKRKKLILRMLNIDSIDKAIISVRRDARDCQTRLKELRSMLLENDGTPRIEGAINRITELEGKIKGINKIIAELDEERIKSECDLKELTAKRNDLRKSKDEFNRLNNKLIEIDSKLKTMTTQQDRLEAELESLKKQQNELNVLQPKKEEWKIVKNQKEELDQLYVKFIRVNELNEQLNKSESDINRYVEKIKNLNVSLNKFADLQGQIKICESSQEKVREEIEKHNKMITEFRARVSSLGDEITKLESKLKNILELGPESECPTCTRVLGKHYKVLEKKFQNELTEMTGEKSKIIKNIEHEQQMLNDSQKRYEALSKKEKYLVTQEKEQARFEENIKNCESELKIYRENTLKLESELEKLGDIKFNQEDYHKLKLRYKELEKIHEKTIALSNNVEKIPKIMKELSDHIEVWNVSMNEKDALEKQISELGFDQDNLDKIEDRFDSQTKSLKSLEFKLKENENEVKVHNKEIEKIKEQITELEEHEERVKKYENDLEYLNKLDSILNQFKSYMISRIAPTLTQHASDLLRDLTDGKYNRMEVDNDYNVSIYDQGEEFPLSRFSGGEEDLANLCLRLAISQVITAQAGTTGPSFVILDEIFGSQDMHRKRNLLAVLNALSNKFRQIFLITHIEDVKEYIEYYLQVSDSADDPQTSTVNIVGN